MKLNIEAKKMPRPFINNNLPFCFEDCIATLANYLGLEYEFMFMESWNCNYRYNGESCEIETDRVLETQVAMYSKLLSIWHGICLEKVKDDYISLEIIQGYLSQGNPIILLIDTYWCPWDPIYQKEHLFHTVLIIGFDKEEDSFICLDPYYDMETYFFPFADLKQSPMMLFTYHVVNVNYSMDMLKESLLKCPQSLLEKKDDVNAFHNLRQIGMLFEQDKIDIYKYAGDLFWKSPIFYLLNELTCSRHKYMLALKLYALQNGKMLNGRVLEQEKEALEKWTILRGMVIKAICLKKRNTEIIKKIKQLLDEIAGMEEEIALIICTDKFLEEKSNGFEIENIVTQKVTSRQDMYYVDIEKDFNNRAFDLYPAKCNLTDFTSNGHYFILDGEEQKTFWNVGDAKYKVNIGSEESYDNISCMGQIIEIQRGRYCKMQIMAAAEYGSYNGLFVFNDAGEEKLKKSIMVQDWSDKDSKSTVMWEGVIAEKRGEDTILHKRIHRIYSTVIVFPEELELDQIVLPTCPNIHIFGITLSSITTTE